MRGCEWPPQAEFLPFFQASITPSLPNTRFGIDSRKVSWILDADIQSFFDTVNQEWLIRFVEHRIGDQRIIRLIRKWLKAGVLEDGVVTVSDRGTGQGAVNLPALRARSVGRALATA